jgi:hypothetical protein
VGGPGGVGKSVFWEAFLEKRPPQPGKGGGVWSALEGPVCVVNLLKCKVHNLLVLEAALKKLPSETPLLLFVEDINCLAGWEHWQDSAISLFTAVGAKGLVVGNSSVVLAHRNFDSLSHTGLRTSTFFLPSL